MSAAAACVFLALQAGIFLGMFAARPEAWSLFIGIALIGLTLAIFRINRLHEDRP